MYSCAYLVENKWRKRVKGGKKGSRQKVKGYLGRVYEYPKVNDKDFFLHHSIEDIDSYVGKGYNNVVKDLIEWEMHKHNVNKEDFLIDFDKKKVDRNNRKAAIMMNGGFLCEHSLRNLMNFKTHGEEVGYKFAKVFVEAGIDVPEELFVKVFERMTRVD